jgi:hypothetical protein
VQQDVTTVVYPPPAHRELPVTSTRHTDQTSSVVRAHIEARRAALPPLCDWCGDEDCPSRDQHAWLSAGSETTWRRAS